MHYYQFNIADYRKRTGHLTLIEHAIYRSLMDTYYLQEGPLDGDLSKLMRSHSVRTKQEKEAFLNVVEEYFILASNKYFHATCDSVLANIYEKSEKARASAKKRWDKKDAKPMRTHSDGSASGMLPINPLPINPLPKTSNKKKTTSPEVIDWMDECLDVIWESYPKKVDKKISIQRLTKMIKANPDRQFFGMVLGKIQEKSLVTDKQFFPTLDRYLRDEKWTDEIIDQGENNGSQPARKLSLAERQQADAAEALAYITANDPDARPMETNGAALPPQVGDLGGVSDGSGQAQREFLTLDAQDGPH